MIVEMVYLSYTGLWIILSVFISMIGRDKKIGAFRSFILAILLSPVLGLIIVLITKNKQNLK